MGVIKIMKGTSYDLRGFERWLNYMANQGLILSAIIRPWCVFSRQEPRDMQYRLEPSFSIFGKKLKEKYSKMGWRYVCRWKGIYVFCALNPNGEVHESPEEHTGLAERTRNLAILDTLLWAAIFTIMICDLIKTIGRNNTPWLNIFDKDIILLLGCVCLVGLIAAFKLMDFLAFKKLKKGKEKLKKESVKALDRKNGTGTIDHVLTSLTIFTLVIMLSYFVAIPVIKVARAATETNYEELVYDEDSDFIRLNDIEKCDKSLVRVPWYFDANFISRSRHVFYNQYNIYEEFNVIGEEWQGAAYYPFFRVRCYEAFTKGVADKIFKDVIKIAEGLDNWPRGTIEVSKTEIKYEGLDEVYLLESEYTGLCTVVARKGSSIIDVMYYGKKPYEELLDVVASKL